MKRFLFAIAASLYAASNSTAAPCAAGPLANYLGAGFTCEIGSAVFSDFNFLLQNDTSDTVALTSAQIMVSPLDFGTQIGLRLSGDFEAVGAVNGPGPTDGLRNISYRLFFDINRPSTLFTNVIATLSGPSRFSPDPFEFGGILLSNQAANDGALANVFDSSVPLTEVTAFNTPRTSVAVDVLLSLTGGGSLSGTVAPVGQVTLRSGDLLYDFEVVVPEPSAVFLTLTGAGVLAFVRHRQWRRRNSLT